MSKVSLQEYSDDVVAAQYRQPLLTVEDALAIHGWTLDPPWCCGMPVEVRSFLGGAYHAECEVCGQFVHDVTGPSFGNSWINLIDTDRIDCNTPARWIAGTGEPKR